jgi:kanamycin nucleotidyltransferase
MTAIPLAYTREQRWARLQEIAAQLRAHYGPRLLALGVYGSVARRADGPYSDIEMYCVIQGEGVDYAYEWTTGPWKAEVDVRSPDTLLAEAGELEGMWSLTHQAAVSVLPLEDPQGIFTQMAQAALDHTDEEYAQALSDLIVGEIYELVGKVRNALAQDKTASLALFTAELGRYAAGMVGLAARRLYPSASEMLADSLTLPDQPYGYAELCQLLISGKLDDPRQIGAIVDTFWEGTLAWARQRELRIETHLEELLHQKT